MCTEKSKPLSNIIFIPLLLLIFLRPFLAGYAYPTLELYYENIILLLAIITLILLNSLKTGFPSFRNSAFRLPLRFYNSLTPPILLLLSAYLISTIFTVNLQNSIKETVKLMSYISVFFIVSQTSDTQKKTILKAIVIPASIISIYAIYQYFWGYQHTLDYLKSIQSNLLTTSSYTRDILISKRAIATFPSPNLLGGYLIIAFFLALMFITTSKKTQRTFSGLSENSSLRGAIATKQSQNKNCFVPIIAIITALILTKSLGAWLSLIITLIIFSIYPLPSGERTKVRGKLPAIIFLISTTLILSFIIINRWERLTNLENPQNSITQRLHYWRTATAIIKDHPFIGVGPGNFEEVFLKYKQTAGTNTRYAHNMFLQIWSEAGILGLAGILYLILVFLKRLKSSPLLIFLSILAFLLHNQIDNTYFIPQAGIFWWVLLAYS